VRLASGMNPLVAMLLYGNDRQTSEKAITKAVQITIAPGAVVFHGTSHDDEIVKDAADKLGHHLVNALGRAARSGG